MEDQEGVRAIRIALERALMRATNLGMLMNLGAPALLFVLAVVFLSGTAPRNAMEPGMFNLLLVILVIVSAADLAVALFLKRRLLSGGNIFRKTASSEETATEIRFLQAATVIYGINLSPTIYGFVLIFLGASIENFLLFVAFTLIGFQLARPRRRDVDRLSRYCQRNFS
jgi:hypothetical protein